MSTKLSGKNITMDALLGSPYAFRNFKGKTLTERFKPISDWVDLRTLNGVLPFSRTLLTPIANTVRVTNTWADENTDCINFGSQDYLGLSQDPTVAQAAKDVIDQFGVHSGGSPVLSGRNVISAKLEKKIAKTLNQEQALLFTNGWMACFGTVAGLVSHRDTIVMDALCHNSLDVGARFATEKVFKFKHNDMENLESKLKVSREKDNENAIFIIAETLYSMNSDSPDLNRILELSDEYEAIVILDMAHDFGSGGQKGLGLLETVDISKRKNVLIIGTFSKNFATTGGFLAGPGVIRHQIEGYAPTFTFTNNITPIQCAIASRCFDIIFSEEGAKLRELLLKRVNFAIREFNRRGFLTLGSPSAIIPVVAGDSKLARIMSREMQILGLNTNIVEFPAVPRDQSLFRFQMMATMTEDLIVQAADILQESLRIAQEVLLQSHIESTSVVPE
jgi:7-keto-8-aminopelargonate synthetase-like enzyme